MSKKSSEFKGQVIEALKKVIDPGTSENIISMGLVKEIEVDEDGKASLTFCPSSPVCPMAFKLAGDIQRAVQKVPGVSEVHISVENFARAEELEKLLHK